MKTFYTSVLILGLFVAVVAAGFLVYGSGMISREKRAKVFIKDVEFNVEVADSPLKQSRGLSGKDSLGENEGMLFLFPRKKFQSFWMKDMRMPIDILWVKDDRINGFVENVQPEPGVRRADLKRYVSPEAVDKVLEVSAGTVERLGIQVGDGIEVSYN